MNLIGRYERLRGWEPGTDQYGPPLLFDRREFDRKRDPLSPYPCEEWWRSPSGLWVETARLLANEQGVLSKGNALTVGANGPLGNYDDQQSPLTFALNTAYTANSAGKAIGGQFAIPETDTLNKVYYYVDSFSGTRANVDDLNLEIRSDTGSTTPVVASAALATASMNPNGFASGWLAFTGLTQSFTAATWYWVIIGDADGGGTDFMNIRLHPGLLNASAIGYNFPTSHTYDTSAGWTTQVSLGGCVYLVLAFASGMSLGYGAGLNGTVTNGTLQRGALYTGGFTAALKIWGFAGSQAINGTATGNIYSGSTGPNSGAAATGSLAVGGGNSTNRTGIMLSAPYTLAAGTTYRLVLKGSTNSTIVRTYKTGTVNGGSAADLMAAMPGAGSFTYTEEASGSPNSWGNDDTNAYCPLTLYVYDQVSVSPGAAFARIQTGM